MLLMADALGPGHLGLAVLLSGRAGLPDKRSQLGGRRPVGPEGQVCLPPDWAFFRGAGLGKQCLRFAITIS